MVELFDRLTDMMCLASVNDYHLYHGLDASKAVSILKTDTLRLPLAETNASEVNPAHKNVKTYYLSFARSMNSGYLTSRAPGLYKSNFSVVIVFDSRELRKHRGVRFSAVDYWGADEVGKRMGGSSEAETRMFSTAHKIEGIRKSIVEVRILVEPRPNQWVFAVYSVCRKLKIPVKLFTNDNMAGFKLGKDKPADTKVAHGLLMSGKKRIIFGNEDKIPDRPSSERINRRYAERRGTKYEPNSRNYVDMLAMYVRETELDKLGRTARSYLYDAMRFGKETEFVRDMVRSFNSDVHNLRGSSTNKEKDRFAAIMKQTSSKKVTELYAWIYRKWYSKLNLPS